MDFPVFISKVGGGAGGSWGQLAWRHMWRRSSWNLSPGCSRQTNLPHCSVAPPPPTWLTAKDQTSFRTTALPSAPVGLAQTSHPLIQGPKMPNTLECGLWAKTSLEKAGPNGQGVLLHRTAVVSQVATNDARHKRKYCNVFLRDFRVEL